MGFDHIGKILDHYLKDFPDLEKKKKEGLAISKWEKIVDKPICNHTIPEFVKNGVLFVRVSDPIWMQELQFYKDIILKKIEKEIGEGIVYDIRFRIGSFSFKLDNDEKKEDPSPGLSSQKKEEMERILSTVNDQLIRERLRRLFLKAESLRR
jgi:hypothetical protein